MATVYEQLGGAAAVEAAVDIFYNKVIADPRISHWFEGMDMTAQRKKQSAFLTQAFGGPAAYSGKDMVAAHTKLVEKGLGDMDFDAVAEHLRTTLEGLGVAPELVATVGKAVESMRAPVLNRQDEEDDTPYFRGPFNFSEPTQMPIPVGKWILAKVLARTTLVEGREEKVIKLTLGLPPNAFLGFTCGQHIQVGVTLGGKWLLRKYTPTSPMKQLGSFEIVVKVYPEGRVSKWLDQIEIGRSITVRGPQGHYDHPEVDFGKDLIMIAGGVGITTCFQFFQAAQLQEIKPRSLHLFYSSRYEDEIVFKQELDALCASSPDLFKVHFTITKPSESWTGLTGRINAESWQRLLPAASPSTKAFICGDDDFVIAMKKTALSIGFAISDLVLL